MSKAVEKNAKFIERVAPTKTLQTPAEFTTVKIPVESPQESISGSLMLISLERADKSGAWSWGINRDWGDDTWKKELEPFFLYYLQRTWAEIWSETYSTKKVSRKKHIFYDITSITKEAIERLIELELDDHERIFRFRIAARKRFYGFVIGGVFAGLWYDPTHQIYPVTN